MFLTVSFQMTTVTSFTSHSHDPQQQAVAVTKLRASLKERAAGSCGTLTQLMSDQTTDTPVDTLAGLGNPETVKCSLRRERAKHMPKNPTSLSELTLDGEWTTTVDGDPFLIYDNDVDSSDRILVFGTDLGLRHLASSDSWYMDEPTPIHLVVRDPCITWRINCDQCLRLPTQQAPGNI